MDLHEQFGEIDIYLFDQLLRKRILPGMKIFDAGCGYGRNLVYFAREGYDVSGVDTDARDIEYVRGIAPAGDFRVEPIESNTFPDASVGVVINSAVLHFARDDAHFRAMLHGSWRVLGSGGLFFCRLASTIGMESQVKRIAGRRHLLPDGSERYLIDATLLEALARELGGHFIDPLKTTVVHNQRSMTTWVLRKSG